MEVVKTARGLWKNEGGGHGVCYTECGRTVGDVNIDAPTGSGVWVCRAPAQSKRWAQRLRE